MYKLKCLRDYSFKHNFIGWVSSSMIVLASDHVTAQASVQVSDQVQRLISALR